MEVDGRARREDVDGCEAGAREGRHKGVIRGQRGSFGEHQHGEWAGVQAESDMMHARIDGPALCSTRCGAERSEGGAGGSTMMYETSGWGGFGGLSVAAAHARGLRARWTVSQRERLQEEREADWGRESECVCGEQQWTGKRIIGHLFLEWLAATLNPKTPAATTKPPQAARSTQPESNNGGA